MSARHIKSIAIYPRPDWSGFLKTTLGMALSLVFIHWVPDLAVWIYSKFGRQLVIDERRMEYVLFVANSMFGIAFTVGLAGLLWSTWHYPKRFAYERDRTRRLSESVEIEIAERSEEMRKARR